MKDTGALPRIACGADRATLVDLIGGWMFGAKALPRRGAARRLKAKERTPGGLAGLLLDPTHERHEIARRVFEGLSNRMNTAIRVAGEKGSTGSSGGAWGQKHAAPAIAKAFAPAVLARMHKEEKRPDSGDAESRAWLAFLEEAPEKVAPHHDTGAGWAARVVASRAREDLRRERRGDALELDAPAWHGGPALGALVSDFDERGPASGASHDDALVRRLHIAREVRDRVLVQRRSDDKTTLAAHAWCTRLLDTLERPNVTEWALDWGVMRESLQRRIGDVLTELGEAM